MRYSCVVPVLLFNKMKQLIYILMCMLTLVSCNGGSQTENDTPIVTVTIEPLHFFVDKIAKGKVDVNVMVPQGCNPETYEPTAQQMVSLSQSALYFKVGEIGFETTWMQKLQQNAPEMKVIDTSLGIVSAKTVNDVADPHTWMSCNSAKIIARNIYKALCVLVPKDSVEFRTNYESLLIHINKVDAETKAMLSTPRTFVIYHPALTYFARDYHLVQLPIEEEGREPSAKQIQSLIDRAKREKITKVFIQKEFSNRNVQTFLEATHATPIDINPLSYDWDKEMIRIAKSL